MKQGDSGGQGLAVGFRPMGWASLCCALAVVVILLVVAAAQAATAASDDGAVESESDAQAPPLIPIESFAAIPEMDDLKLSPDGKVVAGQRRKGGEQFLLIHQLFGGSGGASGTKALSLGKSSLNWVEWANDQYLVASVRLLYHRGDDEIPYDRLMLTNRDGSAVPTVLGLVRAAFRADDVIYWAPDGSHLLINVARSLFEWPEVIRIDIPSNKITVVQYQRPGIYRWFANSRGEIVAGIGVYDTDRLTVIYRSNPTKMFETVQRVKTNGDDEDAEQFYIANIDAQTEKGYVLSRRGGDRWGFYEYDFKTKTFGAPLFTHDKFDLNDYSFDRNGKLRWVSYIDDRWRVKWFQDDDMQFFTDLEKAVPDKNALVVSSSENKDIKIVRTSAPTDPGTFYVYTADSGRMRYLASVNGSLRGQRLAPTQYVTYKARDGLDIPAYLTLPVGRKAERLPLIVMPHGGPFFRDGWDYDFLTQYLANRGYAVLQPNFRGSTGYGKAFEERGYAQFGKAMQDDVDDGVTWLANLGTADPARVCIAGWSYGGYAAQVAAFRNPEKYRCAVSIAGISDLPAMVLYDYGFMFDADFSKWRAKIRGESSTRSLKAVSSVAQVRSIAVPLLIAHGVDDNTVPVSQSDKLAKALKKAGKPFDYIRIEDGDHSLWDAGQRSDLLNALEKFLAAHNPTDVLR